MPGPEVVTPSPLEMRTRAELMISVTNVLPGMPGPVTREPIETPAVESTVSSSDSSTVKPLRRLSGAK